jgi:hypothetical protein
MTVEELYDAHEILNIKEQIESVERMKVTHEQRAKGVVR